MAKIRLHMTPTMPTTHTVCVSLRRDLQDPQTTQFISGTTSRPNQTNNMNNLLRQSSMLNDDDDDDDDIYLQGWTADEEDSFFGLIVVGSISSQQVRIPQMVDDRRDLMWQKHLQLLRHRGEFVCKYRMTEETFHLLVDILSPHLLVDEVKSRNSTAGIQPLDPRFIVGVGVRWLADFGHNILDDTFNISKTSSWRLVNKFLDAVIDHVNNIHLPTTDEELETLAAAWSIKSTAEHCYHGLVLALDGLLSTRTKPRIDECTNPGDYYNGHKKTFAINIQAAVDASLRFRYVCVAGPGKINDGRAFTRCNLLVQWIDNLPEKYFICADNAYTLSNKLLIPFRGNQANPIFHSSYHFYLSQLRIRVEMAFGRLCT
jgi:DDE superfamily endonuclease